MKVTKGALKRMANKVVKLERENERLRKTLADVRRWKKTDHYARRPSEMKSVM